MKRLFVLLVSFLLVINSSVVMFDIKPVKAESAKKMVLVELFTQHWCGPCAGANRALDAMFEESNGKEFIYLKEHMTQGDELGLDYADNRGAKYGLRYWPSVYVNSKQANNADGRIEAGNVKSEISKQKGIKTDVAVEVSGSIDGTTIRATAKYSNVPANASLSIIICEDFTYYAGTNGEKIHRFLLRDGKDFALTGDGSQSVQFTISEKWAKEMMRCIAFVETSTGVQNSAYSALGQVEPMLNKPILSVIPNQVNLTTVKADSTNSIEIKVSNGSTVPGKITFKAKDSFVKIDSTPIDIASKAQNRITATIQTNGLLPGTFKTTIEATGTGVSKVIPVEFFILDKPKVQVSTSLIDFGSVRQGDKATEEITIQNMLRGPVTGSLSTKAKWISLSKKSFGEDKNKITVTAMTDKLESGDYNDEILIKSDGGDAKIEVKITVSSPKIDVIPGKIDFGEIFIDKPPFESKEFTIKNSGEAEATIALKSIPDFCEVKLDKKFSVKPGQEKVGTISLLPSKLVKDTVLKGKIVLDWGSMITEIEVTVSVKESPPLLEYVCEFIKDGKIDLQLRKGDKKELPIALKNAGLGKLDISTSFSKAISWITLSTKSAALLKDQKKSIHVLVDTTKADPGAYDTIIKIVSNGGSVDIPLHIEVIREKIVIELQIGNKTAMISGRPVPVDPPPYIRNGSTLVPLRFIGEAFGAVIDWQPKVGKGTIIITLGDKNIMIEIGNTSALINGQKIKLLAPPEITGGRTFVPLRFISEAFGAQLDWNPQTQTVKITY